MISGQVESFEKTKILGVNVTVITRSQLIDFLRNVIRSEQRGPVMVNNVNVHAMNIASFDGAFRDVLNQSEIVFCDGFGVWLAAKFLGKTIGERMTPPDWIDDFLTHCESQEVRVFFLGDEDQVLHGFLDEVRRRHPRLAIAGYQNGFFEKTALRSKELVDRINQLETDVVVTAMGMPLQEKWANTYRDQLHAKTMIAAGALFRWYCGYDVRGPRWMTDHGFEWLTRLIVQPHKVWRRYLIGLPLFTLRIMKERFFDDSLR